MKSELEMSLLSKLQVWPFGATLKQIESLLSVSETEVRDTVTRLYQSQRLSSHGGLYCLPQYAAHVIRQVRKEIQ